MYEFGNKSCRKVLPEKALVPWDMLHNDKIGHWGVCKALRVLAKFYKDNLVRQEVRWLTKDQQLHLVQVGL